MSTGRRWRRSCSGCSVPGCGLPRTPAGVAAQVCRVQATDRVVYVRIAEADHEDLSVDAALLEHLRGEGLRVPPVVHVEPFDRTLAARCSSWARSPVNPWPKPAGVPPAGWPVPPDVSWPCSTASASLASAGSSVEPRPGRCGPRSGTTASSWSPTFDPWPGPLAALFPAGAGQALWSWWPADVAGARGCLAGAWRLRHRPDLPADDIHRADRLRGDPRDRAAVRPGPLPPAGTGAHTDPAGRRPRRRVRRGRCLPARHELIRRSAVLLGLRQLARWLGPFRNLPSDHPAATGRAVRLRQLLVAGDMRGGWA